MCAGPGRNSGPAPVRVVVCRQEGRQIGQPAGRWAVWIIAGLLYCALGVAAVTCKQRRLSLHRQ